MKKLLSMVLAVGMIVCSAFALGGCTDKEVKYSPDGIKEMTMTGLETDYSTFGTIDWTNIELTLAYEKGDYKTKKYEIDVDSPKSGTEVVIETEGLYAQTAGNLTKGEYHISANPVGSEDSFVLATVKVSEVNSTNAQFIAYENPDFVIKYNNTVAQNATAGDAGFASVEEIYTVGDDNPFKFSPKLTVRVEGQMKSFTQYEAIWTVIENGNAASTDLYTVNGTEIDFTEAAIGKTLTVSVKPAGFESVQPKTMTVKVEDGYNVYNALDLGVINLAKGVNPEDYEYFYNTTTNEDQGASKIFYDTQKNEYCYLNTANVWTEFLAEKGYDVDAIGKVAGAYIHGDINITQNDIPSRYFITAEECGSNKFPIGHMRDGTSIYYIIMDKDFTLNGNYFKIDTSSIGGNRSEVRNGKLYLYTENEASPFGSRTTLFCFTGKWGEYNNTAVATATLKNVDTKGNTGNDLSGEAKNDLDKDTGLIFFRSRAASMNLENTIVKEYFIGAFFDKLSGTDQEFHNKAEVKGTKFFDCFQTGIFVWDSSEVNFTNCVLKRFGGPAMMIIQNKRSHNQHPASNVVMDKTNVVENFVDGTETWFAMQGATSIVSSLQVMFDGYKTCGKTILQNGKLNLIAVTLAGDYLTSECVTYDASFTYADYSLSLYNDATNPMNTLPYYMYSSVKSMLNMYAPVANTSGGALNILVPVNNVYHLIDGMKVTNFIQQNKQKELVDIVKKVMGGQATQQEAAQIMQTSAITGDVAGVLLPLDKTTIGAVFTMYDYVPAQA